MSEGDIGEPPRENPLITQIRTTILDDLNGRKGFGEEYDMIDEDVREEMDGDLAQVIEAALQNNETPGEQIPTAVVDVVIRDLSGRKGLDWFFDELLEDEADVQDFLRHFPDKDVPGVTIADIKKDLVAKIRPLIEVK
jgi:hypothetical protein